MKKKRENNFQLKWLLIRGFFILSLSSARLFPRRLLILSGRILGSFSYHVFPSERKKSINHLKVAFPDKPEKEIIEISKANFKSLGMNFMELLWLPRLKEKHIDKFVKFDGLEIIQNLQNRKKPVLIITGHIGNWELMAAAASLKGYHASVIAKKQKDDWLNKTISGFRNRWGVSTIWREDPSSSKQILSILKNNGILATLMDQDTKTESVFVDFFGRKTFTPSGPAALSLRSGCEVISAYIHRNGNANHKITFKYITPITPTGNREIDIVNRTQQFTSILEDAIKQHPEQWVWMHKRWKTQNINNNKEN